jgi:hypothetical protein
MSRHYVWMKSDTPPKCKLSKWEKASRVAEAEKLLATFYRPRFVQPPPTSHSFNYIVGFSANWHGAYLRFIVRYACPGPTAISPFFEIPFARLGYFGGRDCYNLWARRHNDQWLVLAEDLTLPAAFEEMRTNPWFQF